MTSDPPFVLVVDDEAPFRRMMLDAVRRHGHQGVGAASGEEALARDDLGRAGLVFLDLRLGPGNMDGIAVLEALRARLPELPVVLVTGYGDVRLAVRAVHAGALDFLEKPLDLAEVRRIVDAVLPADPPEAEAAPLAFGGIVPAPGPMRDTLELLSLAAGSEAPLLVTGESGTGKELVASYAHEHGPRPQGPLVQVNCAAIPGELLEAEMFGVERGAFTGATRSTLGRFREADGGTLQLDEIGELDLALQAKLLRVLQDGRIQPIGGSHAHPVQVRLVATTNRDLRQAIAAGRFREDLYFRIAVFELRLPALRERPDDILPLARGFLRELAEGRSPRLAPAAEERLQEYRWPGNIRELRNVMQRAVILARGGTIQPGHLPPGLAARVTPPEPPAPAAATTVRDMERQLILDALAACGGNRSEAARRLGMSRRALYYKLERYGIVPEGEA
ncbi:MAG: sigma-54 dependent transcriptional regulator [Pseudomonadota bacterium]